MSPMLIRWISLLVLSILFIFSFTPIPGTTLIMIYVVLFRPHWFKRLVDSIYQGKVGHAPGEQHESQAQVIEKN